MVNPRGAAIFDYTPEELVGLPVTVVIAEKDRPLVVENIRRRVVGEEKAVRYRFRGRRKNGGQVWVEVWGQSFIYKGRPAILGTVLDVDEQVRALEELKQSEARYRRLFEHSVAGFYRTTVDGRILRVNPALARMLGYDDPSELEGRPISMLYVEEAERAHFLEALRREGRLVNYEVRLRRKDGRVLWGLENVLLVQEPDGTECIEGTLIDVTELLEQRRRYLGLYEHTEDAIFWIRVTDDGQFLVEATNPSHQRKTGLTPEMLWNRPLHEILPPDIVAHVTGNYRRCLEAGHPIEYEETLDLPAGRRTWLTQLVPVPDPDATSGSLPASPATLPSCDGCRLCWKRKDCFWNSSSPVPPVRRSASGSVAWPSASSRAPALRSGCTTKGGSTCAPHRSFPNRSDRFSTGSSSVPIGEPWARPPSAGSRSGSPTLSTIRAGVPFESRH